MPELPCQKMPMFMPFPSLRAPAADRFLQCNLSTTPASLTTPRQVLSILLGDWLGHRHGQQCNTLTAPVCHLATWILQRGELVRYRPLKGDQSGSISITWYIESLHYGVYTIHSTALRCSAQPSATLKRTLSAHGIGYCAEKGCATLCWLQSTHDVHSLIHAPRIP
jgi:hypothetical protein